MELVNYILTIVGCAVLLLFVLVTAVVLTRVQDKRRDEP